MSDAPKKSYRTGVLLLLTLVYGFNFIDRQIVGILAPWIQTDLDLTNTQLGLLIGLAFAAFYTIMGIPLAFLADRINRVSLLSAALAVWSGFTALTGVSQNFLHIAFARVGVGIGEAGGSPPSHSMISDFYGKEERAGALGVYSLGIPLGIMVAYFLTAALMGSDPDTVDWRRIFILLGFMGLFLAVIVRLMVVEPQRGAIDAEGTPDLPSIKFNDSYKSLAMFLGFIVAFAFLTQLLNASDMFLGTSLNWDVVTIMIMLFGVIVAIMTRLSIQTPEKRKLIGKQPKTTKAPSGYIPLGQSFRDANLPPRALVFGGVLAALIIGVITGIVSILVLVLVSFFLITMFLLSLQPGVMTILSIKSWWWMALGIAFASFASYAISGFQTKFLRLLDPDFSPRTFIIWIGIINGTFYVAGTFFGAKLVDWRAKKDIRAYGTIPAISILLAFPLAMAAFWAPSVVLHLAIGAALQLCLGVYLGPSFAIAQTLAPIKLRAMSTALFFFVLNMIALGGGPTFAGAMIDVFINKGAGELGATRSAMYVTFGAYILAFFFYMLVRKSLPKDWADAEARNEQASST